MTRYSVIIRHVLPALQAIPVLAIASIQVAAFSSTVGYGDQ